MIQAVPQAIKTIFVKLALAVFIGLLVNTAGSILLSTLLIKFGVGIEETKVFVKTFFPLSGYMIIVGGLIFGLSYVIERIILRTVTISIAGMTISTKLNEEFDQAIKRVEAEPEKVKPAWDLARVKLELYFDRNLKQINYIFWLSVVVMVVGFGFILFGIARAFAPEGDSVNTKTINPAVVATIAGVITEFIGATFLFLYRSTIQQAANYTKTLERINLVGMTVQIVDGISDQSKGLQDTTKAELVKLLLAQGEKLSDVSDVIDKMPKPTRSTEKE
jgi:nitrate reductase gamma subunit